MSKRSYEINMTEGPLFGKIVKFSIPLALTGVLQLFYNAADMIVVGKFGSETALAAVGSTNALINLIVNVFMGLSVGASVVVAKAIGAGDPEKASRAAHTAIAVSIIAGIGVGIFGFCTSRTILEWMKSPENVIDLSALYVKIYFVGLPATMLYNFGASILRALGDTRRPLYFLILSGIINIALNLLLVIVFGLDVAGVAIATVASTTVSATLVTLCLAKTEGCCKLSLKKLKISLKELGEITKIGLPAGIQGSIFSISNVILQSSVNSFGDIVMAGNSAATSLEGFIFTTMNAVYQAALSFTGQNYGAKKFKRINRICADCLIIVAIIGAFSTVLFHFCGEFLVSLYDSDPEVIAAGMKRNAVVVAPYFIDGAMNVMVGMIRGSGKSVTPMIITVGGICGVRIIWIYTVFAHFNTLFWLYFSYPVSWLVTLGMNAVCFALMKKRMRKENPECFSEAKTV